MIAGTVISILGLYYFLHVRPISDLKKKVQNQEFILDKAKEKTQQQKIKNESFTDKWKTVKDIRIQGIKNETKNSKDGNISNIIGEYNIAL